MTSPDVLVQLHDVCKRFDGVDVPTLDHVDLAVVPGARIAVVGPSGSGKSTLLFLLGLMDDPTEGTVTAFGRDVASMGERERAQLRRERLGFVFQDHHLLPQATALENVLMPWMADGRPDEAARARALDLLARLGLADRVDYLPARLSTGQRQRVAVARALARDPEVILADEPTGALDRANAEALVALLAEVAPRAALVIVTHDPHVAASMDDVWTLVDGRLEQAGSDG